MSRGSKSCVPCFVSSLRATPIYIFTRVDASARFSDTMLRALVLLATATSVFGFSGPVAAGCAAASIRGVRTSCSMTKQPAEREARSIAIESSLSPWTIQALSVMAEEPVAEGWKRHDDALLGLMVFSPEVRNAAAAEMMFCLLVFVVLRRWKDQALMRVVLRYITRACDTRVGDLAWPAWQVRFLKENAARADAMRAKMRRRLRRTKSQLEDLTATLARDLADKNDDSLFDGDTAYSL